MDDDTEAALKLRRAIEFVPEGLAIFDARSRLVVSNSRYGELLDLPAALVEAGTALYDLVLYVGRRGDLGPGDPIERAADRIQALESGSGSIAQRLGKQGQTLEFRSFRLPDGGLVISFADVTTRIAAEEALERANLTLEGRVRERTATLTRVNAELESARKKADEANRDKTRFLAAASHDLLQPLNAARLYTATLIERAEGETGVLARSVEASLNAVEEIMSALLDISRIDSGALTPQPSAFRLSEILEKVAVEFGPLAREKSIALKLVASSAVVNADRALVARIVQNLVSNAIKYTRPGGHVLVGVRARGARLRLDVIDTGIGFNRDQQALLFAEFSRLEQGARMAQGLGLGLSIVERLVDAMGLTIDLDSVEGRGSRFSLYLPRGRIDQVDAPSSGGAEAVASLAGLKVLCVDNEAAVLDAMKRLLQGWGCEVRSAHSLRDIDRTGLLVGWLPDIALMDYHLDQTSGLDAIEWLRQNVGGHLPAALITADRTQAVRSLAAERGISVLTKPVKPGSLRAAISGLASHVDTARRSRRR